MVRQQGVVKRLGGGRPIDHESTPYLRPEKVKLLTSEYGVDIRSFLSRG